MKFSTNRWPVLKSSNFISQLTEMAREQCWEKVSRQFWVSDKNIKGRCFQWEGVLVSFNQLKPHKRNCCLGEPGLTRLVIKVLFFQMKGLCCKCRWWRVEDWRNMLIYISGRFAVWENQIELLVWLVEWFNQLVPQFTRQLGGCW